VVEVELVGRVVGRDLVESVRDQRVAVVGLPGTEARIPGAQVGVRVGARGRVVAIRLARREEGIYVRLLLHADR
jgi:hypothetical protein